MIEIQGEMKALLYISILIVVLYLLKNLFRYLAMFFLATVRNGVVKDLRNALYYKALICLLYTSDAADDLLCVDLGGRRIIKKKKTHNKLRSTKHTITSNYIYSPLSSHNSVI